MATTGDYDLAIDTHCTLAPNAGLTRGRALCAASRSA